METTSDTLRTIEELVSLCRKLYLSTGPEVAPNLARALLDYSRRLALSEEWQKAADAAEEAVAIYHELIVLGPQEFMGDYAAAVRMHAALQSKPGLARRPPTGNAALSLGIGTLDRPNARYNGSGDEIRLQQLIQILIANAIDLSSARFNNHPLSEAVKEYMLEIIKEPSEVSWTKIWALGVSITDAIDSLERDPARDNDNQFLAKARAFLRIHSAAVMLTVEGKELEELSARGRASTASFAYLGRALIDEPVEVARRANASIQTLASELPPASMRPASEYQFSARETAVSIALATSLWAAIVGAASAAAHTWAWPLAAILGFALAPVGLLGGIRRRV